VVEEGEQDVMLQEVLEDLVLVVQLMVDPVVQVIHHQ
jgi:hypothetical protein